MERSEGEGEVEVDGSSLDEPSVSASALSSNGANSSFNQVGERQSVFLGVAVTIQLLAKLTNRARRRPHESAAF